MDRNKWSWTGDIGDVKEKKRWREEEGTSTLVFLQSNYQVGINGSVSGTYRFPRWSFFLKKKMHLWHFLLNIGVPTMDYLSWSPHSSDMEWNEAIESRWFSLKSDLNVSLICTNKGSNVASLLCLLEGMWKEGWFCLVFGPLHSSYKIGLQVMFRVTLVKCKAQPWWWWWFHHILKG